MKTLLIWTLILWFALLLENSRSDIFPTCSVTIPVAVSCLFWMRHSAATILASSTLLIRWMLHPTLAPIEIATVLLCSTIILVRKNNNQRGIPSTKKRHASSRWTPCFLVTLTALVCHSFMEAGMLPNVMVSLLTAKMVISAPCLGVTLFATMIADEFGLRRMVHSA